MHPVKLLKSIESFSIGIIVISVVVNNCRIQAKPANAVSSDAISKSFHPSQPLSRTRSLGSSPSSSPGAGRKVLTSWSEDGSWQASARLPTSSRSGGSDHSRYKIRRDGSLSLALQIPKPQLLLFGNMNRNRHGQGSLGLGNWNARGSGIAHPDTNNSGNPAATARSMQTDARHYSPAELRSFSVVISDVDVTGNYNNVNKQTQDAYSKAGVASYHLKSNSIHRMNASWKLKPSHITPTSAELLEFLSYFANGGGESRATRSESKERLNTEQIVDSQNPLNQRKILGQESDHHDADHPHDIVNDEHKQPFLTWSETSRNIPLTSSTELIDTTMSSSSSSASSSTTTTTPHQTISDSKTDAMADQTLSSSSSSSPNITAPVDSSSPPEPDTETLLHGNENEVVLHELLSKLATLNQNADEEERGNGGGRVDDTDDTIIKNSSENQTKNLHKAEQPEEGEEATTYAPMTTVMGLNPQFLQQTELDQGREDNKMEEEQVRPEMDVEMGESLHKKEEKGDVFAEDGDDGAEIHSTRNTNSAHHLVNQTQANATESPALFMKLEGEPRKKRRNAKSPLFHSATKSTNGNNDDGGGGAKEYNGNARSTSATSLFHSDNEDSAQRMKIADTQQTAADLKKLMSLILKSDGNRNANTGSSYIDNDEAGGKDGKSGAQVVNIVITPNTDAYLPTSSAPPPQNKNNPQKILFLKNPQVKQMLDIAFTDPAVSSAAQRIAAALESNPFPNPIPTNIDHTYSHLPSYVVKHNFGEGAAADIDDHQFHDKDDHYQYDAHANHHEDGKNVPSTPDGFPLTGNGYMNLHHPNLQFHQALHHMVVNGSTPTTINATTKTNIINIFVINFKESGSQVETTTTTTPSASETQQSVNQSPFRIKIRPSPKPTNFPYSFSINPLLVDSTVTTQSSLLDLHRHHSSTLFNKKLGLAAGADTEQVENGGEKNYEPNKNFDTDQYSLSNPSDKINIFDLLPGDLGTVTAVHYAPAVGAEEGDHSQQTQQQTNNNQPLLSSHILDELVGLNNRNRDSVNNNNTDNGNTMKPTTMKYGDYFADFLPDRSRDPPGILVGGSAHNQNMNEPDILSILTSRKPSPPTSQSSSFADNNADAFLPPALAHLEWIFKNQPPPKPQIFNQSNPLSKRKGETDIASSTGSYEGGSDSMMEADETSITPPYQGGTTQELIDFLLKLQNVTKGPSSATDTNDLIDSNSTVPMNLEQLLANLTKEGNSNSSRSGGHLHGHHHHHHFNHDITNSNSSESQEDVIEYTTKKPPAFWKFGNKLPIGSFSNTQEALNNRLRKLMTAFGYSAIPTLAAGAAATWPYWVPLVATGRRRRRKRSSKLFSTHFNLDDDKEDENQNKADFIKRRAHQFLSNLLMTAQNNQNSPIRGPSDRQLLSKSTKNLQREGEPTEEKWIKVDVITTPQPATSSSPTLLHFVEEMSQANNGTSFHTKTDNADYPPTVKQQKNDDDYRTDTGANADQQHQRQQQLDYPILKNFLKNVLYNEFSPHSTKIPSVVVSSTVSPLYSPSPPPPSSSPSSPPTNNKNFNRIITKNGEHTLVTTISSSSSRPFIRPSPTPLPSSLQLPPKRGNNGDGDSEQMIAGSDDKIISISQFSTPSPSSVYIYNRGDGTTTASSLFTHFQHNNKKTGGGGGSGSNNKNDNPWGLFSFGDTESTIGHYYPHHPDKIGGATTVTAAPVRNGHHKNNHNHHFAHYHETNKRLHKLQLADSIKAAEKSYTSAALLPLWLPLFFNEHNQLSSKFKESLLMKKIGVGG